MKKAVQKLYDELLASVSEYEDLGIVPIQKLSGALLLIDEVLAKLRDHTLANPFTGPLEEINFFKRVKPLFLAEQFYLVDLCMIQTARPCYTEVQIRDYLETEMRLIASYFDKHGLLYRYYQQDSDTMDTLLFLRGAKPDFSLTPDTVDLDPVFSTAADHLWARFMAFERLKEWLLEELQMLDGRSTSAQNETGGLRWTGNSVNLAELAYGIWLTGQINNGNVSVTEIVAWLELQFQVKIGDAHRRWQSIAARKRVGPFVYVDEMKAALAKRLEEEWGR